MKITLYQFLSASYSMTSPSNNFFPNCFLTLLPTRVFPWISTSFIRKKVQDFGYTLKKGFLHALSQKLSSSKHTYIYICFLMWICTTIILCYKYKIFSGYWFSYRIDWTWKTVEILEYTRKLVVIFPLRLGCKIQVLNDQHRLSFDWGHHVVVKSTWKWCSI